MYRLYGDPPRLGLFNHKQGHCVPPAAERQIYNWLDTYLYHCTKTRDPRRSLAVPEHRAAARFVTTVEHRLQTRCNIGGSLPTSVLVPSTTVIGRSVLGRMVRQGIPSTVDSSWSPPESVTITRACEVRARKSR